MNIDKQLDSQGADDLLIDTLRELSEAETVLVHGGARPVWGCTFHPTGDAGADGDEDCAD